MSDPDMVSDRTKVRNRTPFKSLSLGAGVQSTVLALMAERGEYGLSKARRGRIRRHRLGASKRLRAFGMAPGAAIVRGRASQGR